MKNAPICALAAIALLGLAAGPVAAQPAVPPFYRAAAQLKPEGRLGQILRQEPLATPLPGAQAWRIAYVSSDVQNRRTVATALVVAPAGPPPKQGRPVMAWAHGTTGTAQNCGPSQLLDPAQPLNQYVLPGGNSWTDYGLPNVEPFLKEGYVVVATDYQGLGGGGAHQYAVAATQARDAIDSVRAAASLAASGAGRTAVVYGWSQGGGAVLAAAGLAEYVARKGTAADGIRLVGFVALAPYDVAVAMPAAASDQAGAEKLLDGLVSAFSDNVFNFTHFAMSVWGTAAAFPGLRADNLFTADGARALDNIFANKCMHPAADTLNYAYAAQYKSLLAPHPANALAWTQAFLQGSVAPVKPIAPVVIYWGTADTVVPPVMGKLYQAQMCALGGNVARVQLPGEQTHFSTPGAAAPLYLAWVKDRVAGRPAPDACPTGKP
jgi:hypothetical protein